MSLLEKIKRTYLVWKLRNMRSQSHFGYLMQPVILAISLATNFQVRGMSMWWVVPIFIALMVIYNAVGYLDIKYGFFAQEQSINNQYSPEIQELLRRTKEQ